MLWEGDRCTIREDEGEPRPFAAELAAELALKGEKLVRIIGKNSLVSDGYRTYFVEDGVFPEVIESLGE